MKKWMAALGGLIVLVSFDQWTKALAVRHLAGGGYFPLAGRVFGLEYVENTGAAFGIFQNMPWLFIGSTIVVSALLIHAFRRLPARGRSLPVSVLTVVLLAGAFGNMIDRIRQGYVVDFLYFRLINFPVFNVADCYVVVSVLVFVILLLFYYKDEDIETFFALFQRKRGAAGGDGGGRDAG